MKCYATDSDYLSKSSSVNWADCLAQTPVIGTSGLGDTSYLYFGKDLTTPAFFLRQTLIRFPAPPQEHSITDATIRLYIASDPAPADWVMNLILLGSTYGTADATDWWSSGGTSRQRNTNNVATDSGGNLYIDIPLDAAQLAIINTPQTTLDFVLRHNGGTTEPTSTEHGYLKVYSHQYATATLRPYITLTSTSKKEQLMTGLLTTLDTIAETGGTDMHGNGVYYYTTPTVTDEYTDLMTLEAPHFPILYVIGHEDRRESQTCNVDEAGFRVVILGGVYYADKSQMREQIYQLVDDVDRCLASNPHLGLSSIVCWRAHVEDVTSSEALILDANRATCLLTIKIDFRRYLNGG